MKINRDVTVWLGLLDWIVGISEEVTCKWRCDWQVISYWTLGWNSILSRSKIVLGCKGGNKLGMLKEENKGKLGWSTGPSRRRKETSLRETGLHHMGILKAVETQEAPLQQDPAISSAVRRLLPSWRYRAWEATILAQLRDDGVWTGGWCLRRWVWVDEIALCIKDRFSGDWWVDLMARGILGREE